MVHGITADEILRSGPTTGPHIQICLLAAHEQFHDERDGRFLMLGLWSGVKSVMITTLRNQDDAIVDGIYQAMTIVDTARPET